jgi:hypothetical protein
MNRLLWPTLLRTLLIALLGTVAASSLVAQPDDAIDWDRARQLHMRASRGEPLSSEEQAYYDRARRQLEQGRGPGQAPGGQGNSGMTPRESTGLVPLTELGSGSYQGESGGLYGDGRNDPPKELQAAAAKETAKIKPVNAQGFQDARGRVVLMSIGMSNTTQEFSVFKQLADQDPDKSEQLLIVDAAQGARDAPRWADPNADVWPNADSRLAAAGATPEQVQVLWIKQAIAGPRQLGEFPAHARRLEQDLERILHNATERFPNVRIAYMSSRIYAGYASTPLNPEPFAYEGAFAIRWLIDAQQRGEKNLNYDAKRGPAVAPLVLWGPYLWGDGTKPRSDGLTWTRADLGPDGTHPSDSGRRKVAQLLLTFFKTDPNTRTWFVQRSGS